MAEFRFKPNEKGFTLAEVLVVVIIIGILVAIAVPVYTNTVAKTNQNVHDANVKVLNFAAQVYVLKDWDGGAKEHEALSIILPAYIVGGEYPENPTKSGPYQVTIDAEGIVTVTPGIGDYGT